VSVATETYAAMESTLLRALANGQAPHGWILTTEMYRQLDYGGDHFTTAARAIHYGVTPNPLYQLPVSLKEGPNHAWELR